MNKLTILTGTSLVLLLFAGLYLFAQNPGTNNVGSNTPTSQPKTLGGGEKVVLYKSPNCGCCVGYAKVLKEEGFDVEVVSTDNMDEIKDKYKIPNDKQSCHTIAFKNYFIEGHVPMDAVAKLLNENPDIEGIGLPRMPAGTPGMPGTKRGPYEVYQIANGVLGEFLTI